MSDEDVLTGFLDDSKPYRRPGRLLPEQLDHVPDPILIADNDRRYIDVNQAAVKALGGTRETIIGRTIDEYFSQADDQAIPDAWQKFISAADQYGTCKLRKPPGSIFMYRSKANFQPGLHISVLRRIK
jgi:PAS domain S-box-containing protein